MITASEDALARFLASLAVVYREGDHLIFSWKRVFLRPDGTLQTIDVSWVKALEQEPERAERLEAFVSRFGRMQDTIGQKLIPRWLMVLGETPKSLIENLARAERLGVLESTEDWLAARRLRNRLIHEYMENARDFAAALTLAMTKTGLCLACYNALRRHAAKVIGVDDGRLPPPLANPTSRKA